MHANAEVFGKRRPADYARAIQQQHRRTRDVLAAMAGLVHKAVARDHLLVEIREQRKAQLQIALEPRRDLRRIDADANNLDPCCGKLSSVLSQIAKLFIEQNKRRPGAIRLDPDTGKPYFLDNQWHIQLMSDPDDPQKAKIVDNGSSCEIFDVKEIKWNTLMPRNISIDKSYIFRILKKKLVTNLSEVGRSMRVALNYAALAKIDSVPNIVTFGTYCGRPWLLMEHAGKTRLDQLLLPSSGNPYVFSPDLICEIVQDLCDTLCQAHALDIAHGDLHWRDIFVDCSKSEQSKQNRVRVLDFSAAKVDDSHYLPLNETTEGGNFRAIYAKVYQLRPKQKSPFEAALSSDVQALPELILPMICGLRLNENESIKNWIKRAKQSARDNHLDLPIRKFNEEKLLMWSLFCLSEYHSIREAWLGFQSAVASTPLSTRTSQTYPA